MPPLRSPVYQDGGDAVRQVRSRVLQCVRSVLLPAAQEVRMQKVMNCQQNIFYQGHNPGLFP